MSRTFFLLLLSGAAFVLGEQSLRRTQGVLSEPNGRKAFAVATKWDNADKCTTMKPVSKKGKLVNPPWEGDKDFDNICGYCNYVTREDGPKNLGGGARG